MIPGSQAQGLSNVRFGILQRAALGKENAPFEIGDWLTI
jgi:hypothetical protein